MKKAEYTDIESLIDEIEDIRHKAVFRFIIKLLREINPGDDD